MPSGFLVQPCTRSAVNRITNNRTKRPSLAVRRYHRPAALALCHRSKVRKTQAVIAKPREVRNDLVTNLSLELDPISVGLPEGNSMRKAATIAAAASAAVATLSFISPAGAGNGAAVGAGLAGFGIGAIVGSALAPQTVYVAPPPPVYVAPPSPPVYYAPPPPVVVTAPPPVVVYGPSYRYKYYRR